MAGRCQAAPLSGRLLGARPVQPRAGDGLGPVCASALIMLLMSSLDATVGAMHSRLVIVFISAFLVPACVQEEVLTQAPAAGSLATGRIVLVDDGSCPAGELRQLTGATPGTERWSRCVPRPTR